MNKNTIFLIISTILKKEKSNALINKMDIIIKVINSIIFVISGIFILKTFYLYFFLIREKKI